MRYEKGEVSKLSTEIGCLGSEKGESERGGGGGGGGGGVHGACCRLF